jgi:hypothetical protein
MLLATSVGTPEAFSTPWGKVTPVIGAPVLLADLEALGNDAAGVELPLHPASPISPASAAAAASRALVVGVGLDTRTPSNGVVIP